MKVTTREENILRMFVCTYKPRRRVTKVTAMACSVSNFGIVSNGEEIISTRRVIINSSVIVQKSSCRTTTSKSRIKCVKYKFHTKSFSTHIQKSQFWTYSERASWNDSMLPCTFRLICWQFREGFCYESDQRKRGRVWDFSWMHFLDGRNGGTEVIKKHNFRRRRGERGAGSHLRR